MAIITHHLRNVGYDKAVDIGIIARGTIGFSGADLQALVNQVRRSRCSGDGDSADLFDFFAIGCCQGLD